MKTQLKTLINKVEFFEKLAVYGDRGSFLKALATEELDYKTKSILQEMSDLLQKANITDRNVLNPLNNALMFGNVDLEAIKQAIISLAVRNTSIANSHISHKLHQLAQQLVPTNLGTSTTNPIDNDEDPNQKAMFNYPKIDKEEQRALGKILTIEGMGLPLDADGVYGPKTRTALQTFKKKFNITSWTDAQALTWAKMLAETDKYI